MIGYSFIEEQIEIKQPPPSPPTKFGNRNRIVSENTECNYLVIFFIVGVFLLVLSDQIK